MIFKILKKPFSQKLIFLLLTSIINEYFVNSQCASFYPRTASQCHAFHENENLCCYVLRYVNKIGYAMCHQIPITSYANVSDVGYMMLGHNNYTKIDCGVFPGMSCTSNEPLIPDDCFDNSDITSNCCMIEVPGRKKRCVYSGNTLKAYYTTSTGITINCEVNNIIVQMGIFLILLFIF